MGCQSSFNSKEINTSQIENELNLNYRQFIMNTRGDVFFFYHFSTLIHRSQNSAIRKVYHRSNQVQRVCKTITVQNMKQLSGIQQIQILKSIDHPNVVKIQQYFIQKQFVYIIFEYIQGPTLQKKLVDFTQMSLSNIITVMKQLLSVVNVMHTKDIAHRAIHPGHILLTRKKDEYMLKLIDFSHSRSVFSPKLKPPKLYRIEPAFNSEESEKWPIKHDIYCCGLIFMALLGGSKYLRGIRGREEQRIREFLMAQKQIDNLNPLLCQMLHKDPQQRPSIIQVLSNQTFTSSSKNGNNQKLILNNLRRCNIKGKLRSALWMFATIKLQSLYNRLQLMQEFYSLDKNKDGRIQPEELSMGLMNTFGISEEEAVKETDRIFKVIDKNNNGEMDFYQFVMGAYAVGNNLSNSELHLIFNEIDLNKDGVITSDELNEAIEGIQEHQLLAENNNKLNFEQFKKLMKIYMARISGNSEMPQEEK